MYWKDISIIEHAEKYHLQVPRAGVIIMFLVFVAVNIYFDFLFLIHMFTFEDPAFAVFGWILLFCILGPLLMMTKALRQVRHDEKRYLRVSISQKTLFLHDQITDEIISKFFLPSLRSIIMDQKGMLFIAKDKEEEAYLVELFSRLTREVFHIPPKAAADLDLDPCLCDDYDGIGYQQVTSHLKISHTMILNKDGLRKTLNHLFGRPLRIKHLSIWNVSGS